MSIKCFDKFMHEIIGAVHIHSRFSDGSGEVPEIAGFANESVLDFIMLTVHNTLRAFDEGMEGWHNNTFVLVGCEINDRENKNHYLAFGIEKTVSTRLSAGEYVNKVKEAGGIGFIAHPHEKRDSMKEHPPYPWQAWEVEDFTGIEIWNHMSEWMEGLTDENKYNRFMHPLRSIEQPPKETLQKWDELSQTRKVVGIGGVDAHAHKVNVFGFLEMEVFPYKVLFKSIRTHIFTEKKISSSGSLNVAETKAQILKSLSDGKCFVANDSLEESKGFRFFGRDSQKSYQMGDTAVLSDTLKLIVILPGIVGNIILIKNGDIVSEAENTEAEFRVKISGVYRVEVKLNNKSWIYSNHIRIVK
jgi:hypothetical protein